MVTVIFEFCRRVLRTVDAWKTNVDCVGGVYIEFLEPSQQRSGFQGGLIMEKAREDDDVNRRQENSKTSHLGRLLASLESSILLPRVGDATQGFSALGPDGST